MTPLATEKTTRLALVTGATGAIGQATAVALEARGYAVIAIGRRESALKGLESDRITTYRADVRTRSDLLAIRDEVAARWGRLDALVNCVGVLGNRISLIDMPPEDIDDLLRVNLSGVISTCQVFLPLLTRTSGAIINMSSTLATRPVAGTAAYSATKGGIEAFSRALALEVAPAVRVNSVSPSVVRSEIYERAGMPHGVYESYLEQRAREYPLGRVGEPVDVAQAIVFLLSPEAAWITGTTLVIDGGRLAGKAAP